MLLFKTVNHLQSYLQQIRDKNLSIGFAPTMGALHQGHLSLIKQSKSENDCTVCSIFVNPTQFNDTKDLKKYPRTTAQDIELLTSVDTDVLFLPSVEEIYPPGLDTSISFDFGDLATVMEGEFRPGHFDGMAQVVKRLLDIVQAHGLYMGQKDFQQLTIVRSMLRQMVSDTKLIMCPIVREEDGLAMSSRNVRLAAPHRTNAPQIHQILKAAKDKMASHSPKTIEKDALEQLSQIEGFRPEYVTISDGISLQPIEDFEQSDLVVICTAVWVGDVRLIDNLLLKNELI